MYNRNVIKYGWVEVKEEECVIDSNTRMARRMDEIKAAQKKQASETDSEMGEEGFMDGLDAETIDSLEYDEAGNVLRSPEDTEPEGPSAEEIREQIEAELQAAREEAEQIRNMAQAEIEAKKREAIEAGRNEGYSAGLQMAQNEADKMKRELEEQRRKLEADYQERIVELEPRFVDTIASIYRHIFNIGIANEKEILLYLIDSTLRRVGSSQTYIVHVSQDDYAVVTAKKKELTQDAISGRGVVEVVEDITLHKNECMIETDGGIFDCGIGTQLEELTKQLKLLSFNAG